MRLQFCPIPTPRTRSTCSRTTFRSPTNCKRHDSFNPRSHSTPPPTELTLRTRCLLRSAKKFPGVSLHTALMHAQTRLPTLTPAVLCVFSTRRTTSQKKASTRCPLDASCSSQPITQVSSHRSATSTEPRSGDPPLTRSLPVRSPFAVVSAVRAVGQNSDDCLCRRCY